jgi:hypothetical protein
MPRARIIPVILVLSQIFGCAEEVVFRSVPAGARVLVDGSEVGATPTTFKTRQVVPRSYRLEYPGFAAVEGTLIPHLAGGRLVGAIFTLGIVAMCRPLYYYEPNPVDVTFGTGVRAVTVPLQLYNLKTTDSGTGRCDPAGQCVVTFASGLSCTGQSVRTNEGTTVTQATTGTAQGFGGGGGFAAAGSSISSGKAVQNTQHGAVLFQCPDGLIDCSFTADAFGPSGFGECTDAHGTRYRLLFLAPQ